MGFLRSPIGCEGDLENVLCFLYNNGVKKHQTKDAFMISQDVFNFHIERTEKNITAHAGLPFFARYVHGLGVNQLADTYLPLPGNAKGYKPSEYIDTFILLLY